VSWIVGMALRDPSAGPVQFARWLHEQGGASGLIGVHVVEELDGPCSEELLDRARHALDDAVAAAGAKAAFGRLDLAHAGNVEQALIAACAEHETDGIIVGRRVRVGEQRFVRLGTVTRRLLRTVAVPVIVVPPDLPLEGIGKGPILVAVTEDWDTAASTYELAERFARPLGRELLLAHVVPPSKSWDTPYLSPDVLAEQRDRQKARAESRLRQWMQERSIEGATSVVLQGKPLESLLQHASEVDAAMIVCGRPKGTALQRWLGGTTATDLTAYSPLPVAVAAAI
jgi:nucleotide-binding universal stress UspA family protein